MGILNYFRPKKKTASVAKERLQLILAHDGASGKTPDYLPQLKADLILVVTKHLRLPPEQVESMINVVVETQNDNSSSLLELNIELPESVSCKSVDTKTIEV